MKKKPVLAVIGVLLALCCMAATNFVIHFYTDFPNSTPISSDFLLFQRNNNFVNAAQSQYLPSWFTSPQFTGTPVSSGNFVVNGIYYGNGLGLTNVNASGTNSSFTYITNFTLYSTNILVQNITNNTFITTNVTIEFPGGLTNLNLTPNSVMYSDANDAEASIPNAVGVLTNNGVGGIGFNNKLSLTEIDALNFYPTNLFTGLTNYAVLGTDGNGLLILGTSTTNLTVTNLFVTTVYAQTNFSTNLFFVSGKGNTLIVTNVTIATGGALTNQNITAKSAVITDANQVETNAVNAHGVFTNSAAGPPSFGLLQSTEIAPGIAPFFNGVNITNVLPQYATNASPANATVTFGNAYDTNLTSDVTLVLNVVNPAYYETLVYSCTNSGGVDHKVTMPGGVVGTIGSGTPPVFWVTNKLGADIFVAHMGNHRTNAWKIDWGP